MNKRTIILLLILVTISCDKKTETRIDKRELQNKTFSIHFESEQDTIFYEFKDSTHQEYSNRWQGKIPWRITRYENANFLVLDDRVIGIKKANESNFSCRYIGSYENDFEMIERKPKWDKELLTGTWVEKNLFDYYTNDSIPKPPPIPKPPAPPGFSESDFHNLPHYKINADSIYLDYEYQKSKSKIQINNTGEFITMNLRNYSLGYKAQENFWRIKYLTDSIMIIDKISYDLLHSKHDKTLTNIKMIKKR
jgi:hypothetical protein